LMPLLTSVFILSTVWMKSSLSTIPSKIDKHGSQNVLRFLHNTSQPIPIIQLTLKVQTLALRTLKMGLIKI
jgi:hypothetical protein